MELWYGTVLCVFHVQPFRSRFGLTPQFANARITYHSSLVSVPYYQIRIDTPYRQSQEILPLSFKPTQITDTRPSKEVTTFSCFRSEPYLHHAHFQESRNAVRCFALCCDLDCLVRYHLWR